MGRAEHLALAVQALILRERDAPIIRYVMLLRHPRLRKSWAIYVAQT